MEAADLLLAYIRRRRFEAKLLARELSEVMGAGMASAIAPLTGSRRTPAPAAHGRYERVHADQLLGEMGITIQ